MMKLVETYAGVGDLSARGTVRGKVRYDIARYQGMQASGLPVPGVHRIEGRLALDAINDPAALVGEPLMLRLEDGRALGITLADETGRVLAEGHGPSRCLCC